MTFIVWIYYNFILPSFIGSFTGIIGWLFFRAIEIVSAYRLKNPIFIYFLPILGLVIAFLYKKSKIDLFYETKDIVSSIKHNLVNPFLVFLSVYISSIFSHFSGASVGKESASVQLGASLGKVFSTILQSNNQEFFIITFMAGMLTAVFTFPMTALFFVLEMFDRKTALKFFIPCLVSVLFSKILINFFIIVHTEPIEYINTFLFKDILKIILLSIMTGILAVIFSFLLKKTKNFVKNYFKNYFFIIFCGGLILVFLTFYYKNFDYNGLGFSIIKECFQKDFNFNVFLLKVLFTIISLGFGYKGGAVVPIMFIGATFGNAMSQVLDLDIKFGSIVGILSMFSIFCNKSFAPLFLGLEMFGKQNFMLYFIIIIMTFIFRKVFSLIKQKI